MEMSRDESGEDARKAERPIKGRGAASRVPGRFEKRELRGEDDGWGSVGEDGLSFIAPYSGTYYVDASWRQSTTSRASSASRPAAG